ncbi:hypothetical protein DCE79_07195 [Lysinibacillus sp. 2017]|uniref:hypothetical protein n=1 Tax=Lysinibacillus sp. 2017 TaxID=2169540 RepID=UPI000D5274B6|nr:hypothetical protein [Lysinibacillus sp. 2017]AWE07179.1 hypothetical protein DCE79_07195 [Lysinibacillus sp. 2017]TGN34637.1 hypothetical protein E4L99_13390 [Lysinibacillus sp. S2017]
MFVGQLCYEYTLILRNYLYGRSNSIITSKEAEEIAIQTAIDEGYANPKLYTEYDTETLQLYHYSKDAEKGIKVWRVDLVMDERPREIGLLEDFIYYINI